MNRSVARPILSFVLTTFATPVIASTTEEFLNAPAWYVQYEVTVASSRQWNEKLPTGAHWAKTLNLERVMSDVKVLDMRAPGMAASLRPEMTGGYDSDDMPSPQVQKRAMEVSMQMMAAMENTAYWSSVAIESEPSSPIRIDYTLVEKGTNLTTEMGTQYDLDRTTTINGEGTVLVIGMGSVLFELDTSKKAYTLLLPFGFRPTGPGVKKEVVSVVKVKGKAPNEEHKTEDVTLDFPGSLTLDVPQPGGVNSAAIIRGTFTPAAGKIVGEQSFAATAERGIAGEVPVTIKFKYTLTTTKPAGK